MPTEESVKMSDLMKYESTLPEGFTGVFYFTNTWKDRDFIGKWGGKEYVFPANSTSPIIIDNQSPLEIQNIRKKFAKDWAEQDFFMSQGYENLRRIEGHRDPETNTIQPTLGSAQRANSYSLDMLASRVQKCLEPLPVSKTIIRSAPKVRLEAKMSVNEEGVPVTGAIRSDGDLERLAKGNMENRVLGN